MNLETKIRRTAAMALVAAQIGLSGCQIQEEKLVCPECPADSTQVEEPTEPEEPPEYVPLPTDFFSGNKTKIIAFAPTNFNPEIGQFPPESSIREDLRVLKNANYKGIMTYGADNILGQIPAIAKEEGMRVVIQGIWDPNSEEEMSNAKAMRHFVDGYIVGNEGLDIRYSLEELTAAIDELRDYTNKPVTTTETIDRYDDVLLDIGDWIAPNAHPYWHGILVPEVAVSWTLGVYAELSSRTDKRVVLKETGLPSGGHEGLSESLQNEFYRTLEKATIEWNYTVFKYFEGFDQLWKRDAPVEPYWGVFDSERNPKEAGKPQSIILHLPAMYTHEDLEGFAVNIDPADYSMSLHINVLGQIWCKPYENQRKTAIRPNGYYKGDVTTGGVDSRATGISHAIVRNDYTPAVHSVPVVDGEKVLTQQWEYR